MRSRRRPGAGRRPSRARAQGETQVRPVEAVDEHLPAARSKSRSTMSPRVGASAVAVNAMRLRRRRAPRAGLRASGTRAGSHGPIARRNAPRRSPASRPSRAPASPRCRAWRAAPERRRASRNSPRAICSGDVARSRRTRCAELRLRRRRRAGADCAHLVAHQRDQRRDDDGEPAAEQRRKLVAQRLAAAGRHDREHIPAGEDRLDDLRLPLAERREAEHAAQQVMGGGEVGHSSYCPVCKASHALFANSAVIARLDRAIQYPPEFVCGTGCVLSTLRGGYWMPRFRGA